MKKGDSPRLDTLEALLAEKRKHEGYLAKLEERRAGTPEHVFARLRDEYLTKLTDAQVRAAAEAEQVASALQFDESAVRDVETRLAQLTEEKVEGELRAAVGEYDGKDWQKKLTALTAGISMAEKERDALRANAEKIRSMLSEAGYAVPEGESPSAPSAPSAPPTAGPSAAKTRATTTITGGPSFDELAFLKSVVGRDSSPAMPVAKVSDTAPELPLSEPSFAPKPEPSSASHTEASSAPKPEPKAQPAAVAEPEPVAAEAVSAPKPEPAAEPERPRKSEAKVAEAPSRASVKSETKPAESFVMPPGLSSPEPLDDIDEPPSALGRPTPRTSQAIKTLKCGECGSMNYPTEWYCERCGGELAAL